MTRTVTVVAGELDEASVLGSISETGWSLSSAEKLYYPYHWFHLKFRARTVLGETALRLSCLVDSRTRVGATTDAFEREPAVVPVDAVLAATVADDEAERIARRYADYVLRHRRKAFVSRRHEVLERAVVHKPFWVVTCERRGEGELRVLVDGIAGGLHPLPAPSTAVPRTTEGVSAK